jgi:hypothetical protein
MKDLYDLRNAPSFSARIGRFFGVYPRMLNRQPATFSRSTALKKARRFSAGAPA